MKNARILFLIPILTILLLIVRDSAIQKESGSIIDASQQTSPQQAGQFADSQNDRISQDIGKTSVFYAPFDRISERATKKPFGIFITPRNSPVQPERFRGYHVGTDFETFPEEKDADVPIYAITDGKILMKKPASGYGGVLVESGTYNSSSITIIYGHLNLDSISKKVGNSLSQGEQIGILGKGYSPETDGERKHFHLGIHTGKEINILGYVSNEEALKDWIDPMILLTSDSE